MELHNPQIILFVSDAARAAEFYRAFGFQETFRAPEQNPVKVELRLGGLELGLATPEPVRENHGLDPVLSGDRFVLTFWADDVHEAHDLAVRIGGASRSEPRTIVDGKLLAAIVEDPDGNPMQLVQLV